MNAIEDPSIQRQCARLNIRFREPNLLLADIISNVQTRLNDHQNNSARLNDQTSCLYQDWKTTHDDLADLQDRLQKISQKSQIADLSILNPGREPSALAQLHAKIPLHDPLVQERHRTNPKAASTYKLLQQMAETIDHQPKTDPPKNSPPPASLTPDQQKIADSLNKTESPLDQLSAERRAKLHQLILDNEYNDVLAVVTLPEPRGWGLTTSLTSLKRFYQRYHKWYLEEAREAVEVEAVEIQDDPNATEEQITAITERFLKIRLLQTCKSKMSSARELRDLFQIQIRQKQLALAELRLQYLMQKQSDEPNRSGRGNESVPCPPRP